MSPAAIERMRGLLWVFPGLAILLGGIVIVGWHSGSTRLVQIHPALVPMQYNTALGFILVGSGMLLSRTARLGGIGLFAAAATVLLGFLTLTQYFTGIDLGIDQLLMKHGIAVGTSHPGRMAPNTAICFFLAGSSTILADPRFRQWDVSSILASLTLGLGLIAFGGYVFSAEAGYGWSELTRMALHTSLGFIAVGSGLVAQCRVSECDDGSGLSVASTRYLTGWAVVLALALLHLDFSMPLGVAAGVLNVLLVLLSWFIPGRKHTLIFAVVAFLLVILGYLFSPQHGDAGVVLMNRGMSLVAIIVTTLLLLNIKAMEEGLRTANRRLDREVAQRTRQLEARTAEIEEMLYIASHDLREPMRTVMSYADFLEKRYSGQFDEKGTKALGFMRGAARRASDLVLAILEYSRIGRDLSMIPVDLGPLVDEVWASLSAKVEESGAVIEVASMPSVVGMRPELHRLFSAMLENALTYRSPDRPPVIRVSAEQAEEDGFVRVAIADNGVGIAPDRQAAVFSIFRRLERSASSSELGVGLAFSRKIVSLHGGSIWMESTPGEGSTFYFTLPVSKS